MTREEQIIKEALDYARCSMEWFNDKDYIGESNPYDDAHSFIAGARWSDENPKNLTLNEYQSRAMTTCTESSDNDTYALFGLMAEVGELADKVAKAKRKGIISVHGDMILPTIPSKENAGAFNEFVEGLLKELGDVLWFVALLAKMSGQSLEDVAQMNLEKLADRAKRNVIIGEGDNR